MEIHKNTKNTFVADVRDVCWCVERRKIKAGVRIRVITYKLPLMEHTSFHDNDFTDIAEGNKFYAGSVATIMSLEKELAETDKQHRHEIDNEENEPYMCPVCEYDWYQEG